MRGQKMKTYFSLFVISAIISIFFFSCQNPNDPTTEDLEKGGCATIQSGTIVYSTSHYLAGQPLTTGFDDYGYNYQAHMFSGSYFNAYAGGAGFAAWDGEDVQYLLDNPGADGHWAWPYRDVDLLMKWNDAWLANKDCDGDGALDRHSGFSSYIGSGAWETNHMWGTYDDGGVICEWDYFTKIIAVPSDANKVADIWYNADGIEIGPDIWGQFATIQTVENDPCAGIEGIQYSSPDHPGFGGW